MDKISQLAGVDKVQIASYIRNRTLKIEAFYKNILEVFINLKSRRDLRSVFKNTLNR